MPFLVALQFLTTLPVHLPVSPEPEHQGASLDWYGVVGLVIGAILAVAGWLLSTLFPPVVTAALILALWVLITGALHLDGLGDCADAWLAPNRARTFEIMGDPRAGPMAIAAIGVVLLIKFAALTVVAEQSAWWLLPAAPILARVGVQVLFATTPYVREGGIGADIAEHLDRDRVVMAAAVMALVCLVFAGFSAWWLLPVMLALFYIVRQVMMRRLLGTTGDSAGASVEIWEAAALALLV